jgi:hypothetical protein
MLAPIGWLGVSLAFIGAIELRRHTPANAVRLGRDQAKSRSG